jgi:hypothetical protein
MWNVFHPVSDFPAASYKSFKKSRESRVGEAQRNPPIQMLLRAFPGRRSNINAGADTGHGDRFVTLRQTCPELVEGLLAMT